MKAVLPFRAPVVPFLFVSAVIFISTKAFCQDQPPKPASGETTTQSPPPAPTQKQPTGGPAVAPAPKPGQTPATGPAQPSPTREPSPRPRQSETPPRRPADLGRTPLPESPFRSPLLAANTRFSTESRLARAPNMFGDLLGGNCTMSVISSPFEKNEQRVAGITTVPLGNGTTRVKIAENFKALPENRVYFNYNHFSNAIATSYADFDGEYQTLSDLDRYTIGLERCFCKGRWSIEFRMPFSGRNRFDDTPDDSFTMGSGQVGNLALIAKRLLYRSESTAVAAGLGVGTPTAGDTTGRIGPASYRIQNDPVHLIPFVGFITAPRDRYFVQGFAQLDIATNGAAVELTPDFTPSVLVENDKMLYEQNLLHLDLGTGYWLHRDPGGGVLTGLAAILELHYVTTLQDADTVDIWALGPGGFAQCNLMSLANRFDQLNLTIGVHTELWDRTTCRIAGVFPLKTRRSAIENGDRNFDAEVMVQVVYRR